VMKPIETGVGPGQKLGPDAQCLQKAAEVNDPSEIICPYSLTNPVAPLAAARQEGKSISFESILHAYRKLRIQYQGMVVEGVGGLMVPLTPHLYVLDLIQALNLPTVVVGRAALGGINHLLLTVNQLLTKEIDIITIILNLPEKPLGSAVTSEQIRSTVELVKELSGVKVLGPLTHYPVSVTRKGNPLHTSATSQTITELVELVVNYGK